MTVKRLRELLAGFEDDVVVRMRVDDMEDYFVEGSVVTVELNDEKQILYLNDDCD